jgi:hypothetical protein
MQELALGIAGVEKIIVLIFFLKGERVMSAIYFHTPNGEAKVAGSERAYFGGLINQMALAVINPRIHMDG